MYQPSDPIAKLNGLVWSISNIMTVDSGKRSRFGYKDCLEITVTPQIVVGGRNKYLINGHVAQPSQLQNLFHYVQLDVINPHFLIMQGCITKVLNMKPLEILSMLEEVSLFSQLLNLSLIYIISFTAKICSLECIHTLVEQFRIPEIRDAITEFHLIVQWSNILRPITRDNWNHHHMNNFVQFFENLQGDEIIWKPYKRLHVDFLPLPLRGHAILGMACPKQFLFVLRRLEESLPDGLGLPSAIFGDALQHNSPPSLDDLAPGSMTPNLTDAIVGNALQHNSPPSLDDLAPGSTTPNPTGASRFNEAYASPKPQETFGALVRLESLKTLASLKTLEKKQSKVDEIDKLLSQEILHALEKLMKERMQYMQWPDGNAELDRLKRFCVAFEYSAVHNAEELKGKISEIDDKAERMRMEIREMETKVSKLTAEKEESMEGEVKSLSEKVDVLSHDLVREVSVLTEKSRGNSQ
ncbi:hypothetical protein HYC85_013660 [Camellia sinensis]|uniref:Uncharacterized protein n=1 Tax=Camellia sinensis TaxID=4442 RepID=A0A7J7H3Z0_CAMSI|nr:hypothetical protein HYC85_013660 [Camellia sinensis]